MKTRALTLLLAVLAPLAWSQEPAAILDKPVPDKAAALVSAMHSDDLYKAGFIKGMQKSADDGRLPQKIVDCATQLDLGFVSEGFARITRQNLSEAEIEEALAFFGSRAGRMTMQTSMKQARAMYPDAPTFPGEDEALGEPSKEEKAQILQYVTSPTARKITAMNTQEGLKEIEAELISLVQTQCFKQP